MGFFDGYNISSSGMDAQRTRINIVSANIANAKTTNGINGEPYKKQSVVFEEVLNNSIKDNNSNNPMPEFSSVKARAIVDSNVKPIMRFEPSHPDANKEGYVAYPDINPVVEMVNLIEAQRAYEANVSAFTTHKAIDNKTIDILKA